jgi:hypothetical protein
LVRNLRNPRSHTKTINPYSPSTISWLKKKKKKKKKKKRNFIILKKKILIVVYFTTKIYKIVTFRYTIKYKRNIYILLVDFTLNIYYIVTKKIEVYLYNKYIY